MVFYVDFLPQKLDVIELCEFTGGLGGGCVVIVVTSSMARPQSWGLSGSVNWLDTHFGDCVQTRSLRDKRGSRD